MSAPGPNRKHAESFVSRMEVLAEELEDAVRDAVDSGDLAHAADLWAASSTVWSAAAHLTSRSTQERP